MYQLGSFLIERHVLFIILQDNVAKTRFI